MLADQKDAVSVSGITILVGVADEHPDAYLDPVLNTLIAHIHGNDRGMVDAVFTAAREKQRYVGDELLSATSTAVALTSISELLAEADRSKLKRVRPTAGVINLQNVYLRGWVFSGDTFKQLSIHCVVGEVEFSDCTFDRCEIDTVLIDTLKFDSCTFAGTTIRARDVLGAEAKDEDFSQLVSFNQCKFADTTFCDDKLAVAGKKLFEGSHPPNAS
jgi:hypothetical protein